MFTRAGIAVYVYFFVQFFICLKYANKLVMYV